MSSKRYSKEIKAKCIEMFVGHNMPVQDISDATGITVNSISTWISKYWLYPKHIENEIKRESNINAQVGNECGGCCKCIGDT